MQSRCSSAKALSFTENEFRVVLERALQGTIDNRFRGSFTGLLIGDEGSFGLSIVLQAGSNRTKVNQFDQQCFSCVRPCSTMQVCTSPKGARVRLSAALEPFLHEGSGESHKTKTQNVGVWVVGVLMPFLLDSCCCCAVGDLLFRHSHL